MPTTTPQHMTALALANEVRLERARLKRGIAVGSISIAQLLERVPSSMETMTIGHLIATQNRWGPSRMRRLLKRHGIPEIRQLRWLTLRQRTALIQDLA